MSEVVVACCQVALAVGERDANRAAVRAAVREAAADGARVVVVPELATSGYVFRDASEARSLAEPLDGPTVREWEGLAAELGLVLVGGLCEAAGGELHNSAVLVDGSGLRAVYRKAHLWDRERGIFRPGDEPPPVVDTPVGRIAVVVCYDLEFPEWIRLPALQGAQLVCAPSNWPLEGPRPARERGAEVIRAQANAAVNRVFVAVADRTGGERGVEWVGGSVVVDPDGYPLAGPLGVEPGTVAAACRLEDADDKRVGASNDVLADRRPELYRRAGLLGT